MEIPANSIATVYLPSKKTSVVKENKKKVGNVVYENGKAVIKIGSGIYHFTVQ